LIGPFAKVDNAYFATDPCSGNCDEQNLDDIIEALLYKGPLAVIVNAAFWPRYRGGGMTYEACGNISMNDMDHAVQLVGFNAAASQPYWIVRNTWSTLWGDHGYIYLEFGRNTCGIANLATYPEVSAGGADRNGMEYLHNPRRLHEIKQQRFERLYGLATRIEPQELMV